MGVRALQEERQQLTSHILAIDRRLYQYILAGGIREWAQIRLSLSQLKVLFLVAGGDGITMTQVARSLGMTLPTATGVVDRLVAKDLVRREEDARDRRLVLLRPTVDGTACMDRLIQIGRQRFQMILEHLSVEDLRNVADGLDILYEAAMQVSDRPLSDSGPQACTEKERVSLA